MAGVGCGRNREGQGQLPLGGWLIFLEVVIASVFSMTKSILAIYTALTIGHQASKRTGLASIGAYIGIMFFEGVIGTSLLNLAPAIIREPETLADTTLLFLFAIVVSLVLSGIYFFICKYLLEKKLNLA